MADAWAFRKRAWKNCVAPKSAPRGFCEGLAGASRRRDADGICVWRREKEGMVSRWVVRGEVELIPKVPFISRYHCDEVVVSGKNISRVPLLETRWRVGVDCHLIGHGGKGKIGVERFAMSVCVQSLPSVSLKNRKATTALVSRSSKQLSWPPSLQRCHRLYQVS